MLGGAKWFNSTIAHFSETLENDMKTTSMMLDPIHLVAQKTHLS